MDDMTKALIILLTTVEKCQEAGISIDAFIEAYREVGKIIDRLEDS